MTNVSQISIFLENKSGRLAKVTDTLANSSINIHALSLADTSDFGILRMIVDNYTEAKKILKDAGFTVGITSVIAIQMPHEPGGLNKVLQLFGSSSINIEYMYAFVHRNQSAVLVFRCQEPEKAVEIFSAAGVKVLSQDEICNI